MNLLQHKSTQVLFSSYLIIIHILVIGGLIHACGSDGSTGSDLTTASGLNSDLQVLAENVLYSNSGLTVANSVVDPNGSGRRVSKTVFSGETVQAVLDEIGFDLESLIVGTWRILWSGCTDDEDGSTLVFNEDGTYTQSDLYCDGALVKPASSGDYTVKRNQFLEIHATSDMADNYNYLTNIVKVSETQLSTIAIGYEIMPPQTGVNIILSTLTKQE